MTMPIRSEKSSSRARKAVSDVRKPTARKKSARCTFSGKRSKYSRQKVAVRSMPSWMRWMVAAGLVVVLTAGFYWFFIRPYAYRWKPCYGLKGYGVCLPCSYNVHGIDISHYQGDIDWKLLASQRAGEFPLRFIFLKATEGGDHGDDTFRANFDSARAHGFVRGAYHYFIPRTDARRQADFFIRTVQLQKGDLPPVLDVETTQGKSKADLQRAVKTWLDCIESHYGVTPILYASYKFKLRYLNDSIFQRYPYWIAHYYVDSVRYEGPWHFWQHTDVGSVPGIKGNVDLNVFNGSMDGLDSLCLR